MSDINFDLKQIRSFLTIISEGSFTGASRRLRVGQATMSHHMNQLEEALGTKLLIRSKKTVTLTGEGEAFAKVCQEILSKIETAQLEFTSGVPHGIVKIAASTIPSAYLLPSAIAKVRKDDEACQYSIISSDSRDTVEMIKDRTAEIGVVGNKIEHPLLTYKKIFTGEILLVGTKSMPDVITAKNIVKLPLVMREAGSGTRKACERALQKHRVLPSELNVIHESSTSEGVRESVKAGIGAAFISSLAVENELKLGQLKIIQIENLAIPQDFYAVYHATHELTLPAKKLIKALQTV
jgi:DNA-binding transcriptional LysR family regulator